MSNLTVNSIVFTLLNEKFQYCWDVSRCLNPKSKFFMRCSNLRSRVGLRSQVQVLHEKFQILKLPTLLNPDMKHLVSRFQTPLPIPEISCEHLEVNLGFVTTFFSQFSNLHNKSRKGPNESHLGCNILREEE